MYSSCLQKLLITFLSETGRCVLLLFSVKVCVLCNLADMFGVVNNSINYIVIQFY